MPKMLVLNYLHLQGKSKKPPFSDYDFTTLVTTNLKVNKDQNFQGTKVIELSMDKSLILNLPKLPAICDITYDIEAGFDGKANLVVTSIVLSQKLEMFI